MLGFNGGCAWREQKRVENQKIFRPSVEKSLERLRKIIEKKNLERGYIDVCFFYHILFVTDYRKRGFLLLGSNNTSHFGSGVCVASFSLKNLYH